MNQKTKTRHNYIQHVDIEGQRFSKEWNADKIFLDVLFEATGDTIMGA